jgi:hypothetical protein
LKGEDLGACHRAARGRTGLSAYCVPLPIPWRSPPATSTKCVTQATLFTFPRSTCDVGLNQTKNWNLMKRQLLYILIALLVGQQAAQAQRYEYSFFGTPPTSFSPSYSEYEVGDLNQVFRPFSRSDYSYAMPGMPSILTTTDYAQASPSPNYRRTTTYDSAGRIIEYMHEIISNYVTIATSFTLFEYDIHGNITKQTTIDIAGTRSEEFYQWTYVGNQPISVLTSDTISPRSLQRYSYNSAGEVDTIFFDDMHPTNGPTTISRRIFLWHAFSQARPAYIKTEVLDPQTGTFKFKNEWMLSYYANDTLKSAAQNVLSDNNLVVPAKRRYFDTDGFISIDSIFYYNQAQLDTANSTITQHTWTINQGQRLQVDQTARTFTGQMRNPIRYLFGQTATSASAQTQRLDLQVYPNPASERLFLQLAGAGQGQLSVEIFDQAGRLRMQMSGQQGPAPLEMQLSSQLENGSYLCKVTTKEGIAIKKIVIMR